MDENNFFIEISDTICTVTIIDDDKPGKFSFIQPNFVVTEADEFVELKVVRTEGGDGAVTVEYQT